MKLPWKSSLVTRLTILLGLTMAALWLLTESAAVFSYYSYYSQARSRILFYYQTYTEMRAQLESERFIFAQNDALRLLNSWREHLSQTPHPHPIDQELSGRFWAFDDSVTKLSQLTPLAINTIQFLVGHTIGNQVLYRNSFIIIPNEGIAFDTLASNHPYVISHIDELRDLLKQPSSNGYYWGKPYYDQSSNNWCIPVATATAFNGQLIYAGYTMHINQLVAENYPIFPGNFSLLFSRDGKLLPILPSSLTTEEEANLEKQLASPDAINFNSGNYYVTRAPLKSPPWELVNLYPYLSSIRLS
ncbi:hybrid sensor histidine kinase/response regulator [Dongshaea marina]|uniref:hypothetical protein n=1 Tax=Dongshaea marina TaxID=2047966 RepID=UPI000D3E1236|nr:hypothetical protein [Dongshaea marina]